MKKIKVKKDTWFKQTNSKQSHELPSTQKYFVAAGTEYPISRGEEASLNHVYFSLEKMKLGINQLATWYAYEPHIELVSEANSPGKPPDRGIPLSLVEKVVKLCEEKGYPLDRSGDVNIIGIEGMNLDGTLNGDPPGYFNDLVGILKFKQGGEAYFEHLYQATTEPGIEYTTGPKRHKLGAARMALGYHKGIWTRGKHRDKYNALVNWGNPARFLRDQNQDFSRVGDKEYKDHVGLNLHSTSSRHTPDKIGLYSAGCTVIRKWSEFVKLRASCYASQKQAFDYILVMGSWL